MKKKIGIIVDNEFFNDVRVLNEVKILSDIYDVFVLCFSFSPQKKTLKEPLNITIKTISISKKLKDILFGVQNTIPLYDYFWAYHIRKFIQKNSLICIHVHDLYMSYSAYLATKKSKIPYILDLHENYPSAVLSYQWSKNFFKKLLAKPHKWAKKEQSLLKYATKIIVLSENFKQDLLKKYNNLQSSNVTVFSNVPDLQEFKNYEINSNILEKEDKFILFYFGVISERRGILTCIEALKILNKQYPQIYLLLIGPVDKAESKIFQNALSYKNIIHYKWKDISTFPSYASISDVCLSPLIKNEQHESGLANKIFQYALFKKPLIVSDCKPQKEFVEDNNCGLVFKSNDCNDLVNKITLLLNNPHQGNELGKNGVKAVENSYNLNIFKTTLLSAYFDLINL